MQSIMIMEPPEEVPNFQGRGVSTTKDADTGSHKKNEGKERSQIEGIVEDATDNEHEQNPEAQSSMPLGLTNTDAIFQMENLREKSNPEAREN